MCTNKSNYIVSSNDSKLLIGLADNARIDNIVSSRGRNRTKTDRLAIYQDSQTIDISNHRQKPSLQNPKPQKIIKTDPNMIESQVYIGNFVNTLKRLFIYIAKIIK